MTVSSPRAATAATMVMAVMYPSVRIVCLLSFSRSVSVVSRRDLADRIPQRGPGQTTSKPSTQPGTRSSVPRGRCATERNPMFIGFGTIVVIVIIVLVIMMLRRR